MQRSPHTSTDRWKRGQQVDGFPSPFQEEREREHIKENELKALTGSLTGEGEDVKCNGYGNFHL